MLLVVVLRILSPFQTFHFVSKHSFTQSISNTTLYLHYYTWLGTISSCVTNSFPFPILHISQTTPFHSLALSVLHDRSVLMSSSLPHMTLDIPHYNSFLTRYDQPSISSFPSTPFSSQSIFFFLFARPLTVLTST